VAIELITRVQSVRGRLRRAYKTLYPWANSTFELWLLAHNVAYLFDRTAFYRPWLAWIGVDVRRVGLEDLVRLVRARAFFCTNPRSEASTSSAQCTAHQKCRRGLRGCASASARCLSTAGAGLAEGTPADGDLLHQVPRVVVRAVVARARARRPCCAAGSAAASAAAARAGRAGGRAGRVRRVPAVRPGAREPDGAAFGIRVLLPVRARARRRARRVPGDGPGRERARVAQGARVIARAACPHLE
jgi:hypothetical protein